MKTFPKTIYIQSHDLTNAYTEATIQAGHVADGVTLGIYELRAIRVLKKTVTLVDLPPSATESNTGGTAS